MTDEREKPKPLNLYFVTHAKEGMGAVVVSEGAERGLDALHEYGLFGWTLKNSTVRSVQRNIDLSPGVHMLVPLDHLRAFRDHSSKGKGPKSPPAGSEAFVKALGLLGTLKMCLIGCTPEEQTRLLEKIASYGIKEG